MFNTKVPLYGIIILLALIFNIITSSVLAKKHNFDVTELISMLLYENIGIILGAKILTYIEHYKELDFNLLKLGLSSYGGVIGAIVFLLLFAFQFKKSVKKLLFIFMPSIPLMYAIGKIGCFLVGCCYGIEYTGIGNIVYKYSIVAPLNVKLFPVQIVETIVFALIFIYMLNKSLKNQFTYKVLGISFILCGISKFLLDFLRMSHFNKIISFTQIISILFIVIGMFIVNLNEEVK